MRQTRWTEHDEDLLERAEIGDGQHLGLLEQSLTALARAAEHTDNQTTRIATIVASRQDTLARLCVRGALDVLETRGIPVRLAGTDRNTTGTALFEHDIDGAAWIGDQKDVGPTTVDRSHMPDHPTRSDDRHTDHDGAVAHVEGDSEYAKIRARAAGHHPRRPQSKVFPAITEFEKLAEPGVFSRQFGRASSVGARGVESGPQPLTLGPNVRESDVIRPKPSNLARRTGYRHPNRVEN